MFPSRHHPPLPFKLKCVLPTSTLNIFSSPQVPQKPVLAYQTHILLHEETNLDLMISVKRQPPGPCGQTSSMHKWWNNGERNHKTSSSGAISCTGRTIVGNGGKKNHISLKGDMNLSPTLAAGTVQRPSDVKQQLRYRLNENLLSFLWCSVSGIVLGKKSCLTHKCSLYFTFLLHCYCAAINHHTPFHPFLSNSKINIEWQTQVWIKVIFRSKQVKKPPSTHRKKTAFLSPSSSLCCSQPHTRTSRRPLFGSTGSPGHRWLYSRPLSYRRRLRPLSSSWWSALGWWSEVKQHWGQTNVDSIQNITGDVKF